MNPKVSIRKEITNVRAEKNEIEIKKTLEKIMKLRTGSLHLLCYTTIHQDTKVRNL